ncbi:MAG TPA: DUF1800 domain-containing protein [Bacteroidota bacterium]|nr:DUF1800 domain-containing protein [Bacteroidota bacterium]
MTENPFANKTLPHTQRSSSGIEPYAGPWGIDEILHLTRRTLFGIGRADLASLKTKTMAEIVSLLLAPTPAPDPPPNNYSASVADPDIPPGQTWVNAPFGKGALDGYRRTSIKAWWIGLMIAQPVSIGEMMTLFWHNHFATEAAVVGDARYTYMHLALLRRNALGNFKDLVKQVTIDPNMLRYLNGNVNTRSSPNENYGREMLELFTIGKGPERAPGDYTNYTEDDVKAAARVLTGWRDDSTTTPVSSYFDAERTPTSTRHDTTNKQFSAAFNQTIITGRTGADGKLEIDDLIAMVFAQTETSKYIVRKLYRWFVYYVIDAAVEANVIAPLADILRSNNFEIAPVLQTLLTSAHFYDPVNRGCVIKNPIDFTVGLCRQYSCSLPTAAGNGIAVQYQALDYLRSQATSMNMNAGDPPDVAGWAAYWLTPQYYQLWINSDTLPKRFAFSDLLISTNGYSSKKIVIDPLAFAATFTDPSDPNLLITEMCQFLFAIPIDATQQSELKTYLLSGQTSDYYWTDAWNTYMGSPADITKKNIVFTRLQSMIKYMMSSMAEYQLT